MSQLILSPIEGNPVTYFELCIIKPTELLLARFAKSVQIFHFSQITHFLFRKLQMFNKIHKIQISISFHLANYSKPFTDCCDPEVIK